MDDSTKTVKKNHRAGLAAGLILLLLAAAAGGWYYYNLPAQRLQRALREADGLMEEEHYEEAAAVYAQAGEIVAEDPAARDGYIRARLLSADRLAGSEDISLRGQACALYEEVISLSEGAEGSEASRKLTALREKNAASFDAVRCETVREDRSGSVALADGSEVPYTCYYDLVQIKEDYYPYADRINEALTQQMNAFFSEEKNDPATLIRDAAGGPEAAGAQGDWRDYVGEAGIYSGQGLVSIRMAEVRIHGQARSNYYRGRTFRLSDARELTLADLTGKSGSSLRRLARHRIWAWLEDQGYREISKSDVEDYVEDTDPDAFKFCIREDGTLCLVIDQEVPFFSSEDEILEIPLETDAS